MYPVQHKTLKPTYLKKYIACKVFSNLTLGTFFKFFFPAMTVFELSLEATLQIYNHMDWGLGTCHSDSTYETW
jgi:hypothetical protein